MHGANGVIRVNITILPYKDKFTGESICSICAAMRATRRPRKN